MSKSTVTVAPKLPAWAGQRRDALLQALAHLGVVRAEGEPQLGGIRNHVGRIPREKRAHGDDGRVGSLDVARHDGLQRHEFTPLRSDRLAIIASPQHPLAGAGPLALADLAAFAWSLPAPHQPAGQVFETACEAAGLVPRRSSLQSVSTSLLCQITQDHHTLAALPHAIVGQLLAQGLLVELPLHTPLPLPGLGALHGNTPPTSALGQLLSTLQQLHAA